MIDDEKQKLPQFIIDKIMPFVETTRKLNSLMDELMYEYYKTEELPAPKSKYKVGNLVFVRNYQNIKGFVIDDIVDDGEIYYLHRHVDGGYTSTDGCFDQYDESELYPTKSALIESQIAYWEGLREPSAEYCEHSGVKLGKIYCEHKAGWKHFDCETCYPKLNKDCGLSHITCEHGADSIWCVQCHPVKIVSAECNHMTSECSTHTYLRHCDNCDREGWFREECEHENSGTGVYWPTRNGGETMRKCKKFGEFYR